MSVRAVSRSMILIGRDGAQMKDAFMINGSSMGAVFERLREISGREVPPSSFISDNSFQKGGFSTKFTAQFGHISILT